jgi:hypothetical protein
MSTSSHEELSVSTKQKPDLQALLDKLSVASSIFRRYSFLIFLLFIAVLYGFVLYRISGLDSQQPTADAVSSQVKAAKIPHINQAVVDQLQSLQDNSVSVKALFNQARNNPFQQ